MQLKEYFLSKNSLSKADLAKKLGVSRAWVTKLCGGGSPSLQLMVDIAKFTGNAVTVVDWVTTLEENQTNDKC